MSGKIRADTLVIPMLLNVSTLLRLATRDGDRYRARPRQIWLLDSPRGTPDFAR